VVVLKADVVPFSPEADGGALLRRARREELRRARRPHPPAGARPLSPPFNKLFRAFALRRAGLVSESKNKLQYT
jgi:hypothetical protein